MTRLLRTAILLTTAAAAQAQAAGGPPIAYVKFEGSGASIYLANDGGSAPVKLYTTGSKRTIGHVDLRPGGGEIAFTEFGSGSPRIVKILSFDDAGRPLGSARELGGVCGVDTVDYHPDGTKLIISEICAGAFQIAAIGTDGTGHVPLITSNNYLNKARWLKDGVSYVYARSGRNGGPMELCRNACEANDLLWTGSQLMWMDVGRQSNLILFDSGGIYTHRLDADTATLQTNFLTGTDGHFSPGDADVLYETPHEARGDYLMIRRSTGATVRLTAKGEYGSRDWRN